jgi:hypothetical protein
VVKYMPAYAPEISAQPDSQAKHRSAIGGSRFRFSKFNDTGMALAH